MFRCPRPWSNQISTLGSPLLAGARPANVGVAILLLAATLWTGGPAAATDLLAVDAAQDAGIYFTTRSWSVNVHDFDRDGWPDVLIGVHGDGPARLYRNDAGSFTEVNAGLFKEIDRHDCAWEDVNQDALPDAYCTVGADQGGGTGRNELWIQQTDQTFIDMAESFGVLDEYGRGRHTVFLDVNHDAYPDLFVGNAYPRDDDILSPNRLFINEGGSSFRDAPEYGLEFEIGASCADTGDFNGDGWEDLLVCGKPDHGLLLYRNDQGVAFTDVSEALGITGSSHSAVLVDLNADGSLDLARVKDGGAEVQLQADGAFEPPVTILSDAPYTGWIAAGDVNRDSYPDLYALEGCPRDLSTNSPDHMLLNRGTGIDFVETPIPQTTMGCGDVVEPIDYDLNGNTDFIVLNGVVRHDEGPVQLISFSGSNDVVPPTATLIDVPPDPSAETSATFTFSADEEGVTFTCSLDGAEATSCESGITYTELAEGPHAFSVSATDSAGNTGAPATYGWNIDLAPIVIIDSGPTDPTAETSASFTFSADEEGVTFTCSLDGAEATSCESGITYTELAEGPHAFSVSATDSAGNTGAPATYGWNIVALLVRVADFSFSPAVATSAQGSAVTWSFTGPSAHTVADSSGMGLFASPEQPPDTSYEFTFPGAGAYNYACTIHPNMTGRVRVGVLVSPQQGDTGTVFQITWASAAPPTGFVFDVQIRRPGSPWTRWLQAQTATGASFTPDAGTGTYSFRARLRNPGLRKASKYSPGAPIDVT